MTKPKKRDLTVYHKEYYQRPEVKARCKVNRDKRKDLPEVKVLIKKHQADYRKKNKDKVKAYQDKYRAKPEVKMYHTLMYHVKKTGGL